MKFPFHLPIINVKIVVFLGIFIRLLVLLISPEIADTKNYHLAGKTLLETGTIYTYNQDRYPYPPLWIFYEAFSVIVGEKLNLPFVYIVKIPIVLADIGLILLLNRALKFKKKLWLYAFNPLVIFISSALGQFDPVVIFLVFLAYLKFNSRQSIWRTGILLSIAMAFKTYPILLFPPFLSQIRNIKNKIIFTTSFFLPFLLIVLLPLLLEFEEISNAYFSYTGSSDYGLLAMIKSFFALAYGTSINFSPINYLLPNLQSITKNIFIISYFYLVYLLWRFKVTFLSQINLTFLLFYIVDGGATQYLFWIIPFLVVSNSKVSKRFTILSSLVLTTYMATQFYEPVLKYYNFVLFKTPLPINLAYFITTGIFWIYLIKVFLSLLFQSLHAK